MIYPYRLIPRPSYKRIEVNGILDNWLCRATSTPQLIPPDEEGEPYPEENFFIEGKWTDLYDYSTNLLGHYLVEDICIGLCGSKEAREYFRNDWNFTDDVEVPVFEDSFEIMEPRGTFFLPISKVHQKLQISTPSPPRPSGDVLTAIVVHTPTNCNFWHFSIRWVDSIGNHVNAKTRSEWKEQCAATMRAFLSYILSSSPPVNSLPLPNEYFTNHAPPRNEVTE